MAERAPAQYAAFLERALQLSDRYDNNLEIQRITKEMMGSCDRGCVKREFDAIQKTFENRNPLALESVPAVIAGGRILYGVSTLDQWQALQQGTAP